MSNEEETKSVKPLADLIGIDFGEMNHLSGHPERIDEGMEKKLERISHLSNNAEDEILTGIEVLGHLMWHAGSHENCEAGSVGVDDALLREGGYFIKNLAEMLRAVLWQKDNAEYARKCALEYRLKQGGAL